jgi:RNA ligase
MNVGSQGYPIIQNIKPILEAIDGRPEFKVRQFEEYQTVSYHSINPHDTFPDVTDQTTLLFRECRGIAFDLNGRIISRPFHKFFNLEERAETQNVLLTADNHMVLDKVDGSMIHMIPKWHNGELSGFVCATKAGETTVSALASAFISTLNFYDQIRFKDFVYNWLAQSFTPIFEFCSRENRVVLDYGHHPKLILLAIRNNITGDYLTRRQVQEAFDAKLNNIDGIELVKQFDSFCSPSTRNMLNESGLEGVVVLTDQGKMYKVKTEWYLTLHKVKESIAHERNIIKLILNECLDDLLPLLSESDKAYIQSFAHKLSNNINQLSQKVSLDVEQAKKMFVHSDNTRRDVAQWMQSEYNSQGYAVLLSIFWNTYDGKDARQSIISAILKKCGSQTHVNQVRELIGCEYDTIAIEE